MANKAQIRKDQADAIEAFLQHNSKRELLDVVVRGGGFSGTWYPMNNMPFDELATALYVGYEIKKTPEQLVREYYEELTEDYMESTRHSIAEITAAAKRTAVRSTLKKLDIKIEGVNG